MKATKHNKAINKCLMALSKYYSYNDKRDSAENLFDESSYQLYDRICEREFDKYLELYNALPKYIQKAIDKYDSTGTISPAIAFAISTNNK